MSVPAQLRECLGASEMIAPGDYHLIGCFVAIACPFCGLRAIGGYVTQRSPLTVASVDCDGGHRFTVSSGKVSVL